MKMKGRQGLSFFAMFFISAFVIAVCCKTAGFDAVRELCISLVFPKGGSAWVFSDIASSPGSARMSNNSNTLSGGKDKKTSSLLKSDPAYVPEDIQKLIDSAKSNEKNDKKDGVIVEHTYDKSSATDRVDNFLIRDSSENTVDFEKALARQPDLQIKNKTKDPSVLIFHTHTTESYQILDRDFYAVGYTTRSEDPGRNMVRVGNEIAAEIEKGGYKVIHDTNIYDKFYSGAYDRSAAQIDKYLKEYPSIKIILDIHRDAIQDDEGVKTKPVCTVNNKKCAQIMIISGCEGDGITDFPDWMYNLSFALRLQQKCESTYPGFTRPLLFDNRKYNMDKSRCSLLIEMGSDANTLDEAAYAGRLLGRVLEALMEEYTV